MQKIKAKLPLQKTDSLVVSGQGSKAVLAGESIQQTAKTTLSDWAGEPGDDDMHGFYSAEKRQRGGRKKRKKNKESQMVQNWDDIYDPSRPNSYEEYQNSEEKMLEIREWKDRLYAHRFIKTRASSVNNSSDGDPETRHNTFVAPLGLSFAPPTNLGSDSPTPRAAEDAAGEGAYARRPDLSSFAETSTSTVRHASVQPQMPTIMKPPQISTPDFPTAVDRTPQSSASSISRAPVRYNLPSPPSDIPKSETELIDALQEGDVGSEDSEVNRVPRSSRPGQKGFAERLMSKYGWTKGSGLGASGNGIVNPLRVQVEKQKKKPDSEGGGYVGPGGRGKIIGGKKAGASILGAEGGKFGVMSEVIILRGMLNGLDLDAEMGRADGGLLQEIGDECGEKYGRVERVYVDRHGSPDTRVFVRFTSQLSALRAVNALQGRIFNGNTITATFYDMAKFDSGIYD
ncbi:MAG: hypothetical protein Q9170_003355 [Blastenia crenularia]